METSPLLGVNIGYSMNTSGVKSGSQYGASLLGCQTGAMALKIAPMNVFERQRPFYGHQVPAK